MAARRTTRFITGLALAGLMLGSSPLAPGSLAASPPLAASSLSDFCGHLEQAIQFLQAHPSRLNDFLLRYFQALQARYCEAR